MYAYDHARYYLDPYLFSLMKNDHAVLLFTLLERPLVTSGIQR